MISTILQILFAILIVNVFCLWSMYYKTNIKKYDVIGWYLDTIAFAICLIDISFFRQVDKFNYFIISVAFIAALISSIRLTYEKKSKKD